MTKTKIGFIGCGFMGQLAHLANYSTLPECEVTAITERKKDLGRRVAEKYGIQKAYTNFQVMMQECELDALVVTKKYEHHLALLPEIIPYKIPIIIEKPLCVGWETGEELCRLARENNTIIAVAYHKRSDPAIEYAKKIIGEWKQSGICGKMLYVRLTIPSGDWIQHANEGLLMSDEFVEPVHVEKTPAGYSEETAARYQKMVNYYVHHLNLMRFLMEEDYEISFVDKQETVMAVNGLSGTSGIIEMTPYTTRNDWQEKAFVSFEKGWIEIEIPAPMVEHRAGTIKYMTMDDDGEQIIVQPILPSISAMRKQAMNFIDIVTGKSSIADGTSPLCSCEEALKDLYIARDYIKMLEERAIV
ncbi:MAG: Gfo/Idh/MocA family protein [Saccharofermentanales bacterium]